MRIHDMFHTYNCISGENIAHNASRNPPVRLHKSYVDLAQWSAVGIDGARRGRFDPLLFPA
jgi:hypothetical protein